MKVTEIIWYLESYNDWYLYLGVSDQPTHMNSFICVKEFPVMLLQYETFL